MLIMLAIMFAGMLLFRGQKPVVVKPITLADVQTLQKSAGTDAKKLNDVIKAYGQVIDTNKGTETEAKARFEIALINETKLAKKETVAVTDYKALIQEFPNSPITKDAQQRLDDLQEKMDVKNSREFGYKFIDSLVALTGRNPKYSFFIALLIITLIVKIVTTPLSHKQYQSMKEMQKVAPLVKEIQEKYKGDQQVIGQKTMDLYKEHKVNPFASCLPLLIQMPILIGLYYKVILAYQFQFTKGHFLWIGTAASQHMPAFYKLTIPLWGKVVHVPLIASNLSMPDLPLLLLYTASMVVSQKLTVVDPTQAEQQKVMAWMMPLMFAFIFASFPAALMLYWLLFNIFSTAQQYYIMKPKLATAGGPEILAAPVEQGPIPSKVSKKKKKK
jgi:YidC/Oxa1 family membrane protein insertase